ncbi:hypothetical protein EDB85DRAFT_142748 [Lactarius pseudohatsudake]|nr:hypothetical protein EDB85DRAFT_142748 [Lactarius pseudohatsudake]
MGEGFLLLFHFKTGVGANPLQPACSPIRSRPRAMAITKSCAFYTFLGVIHCSRPDCILPYPVDPCCPHSFGTRGIPMLPRAVWSAREPLV